MLQAAGAVTLLMATNTTCMGQQDPWTELGAAYTVNKEWKPSKTNDGGYTKADERSSQTTPLPWQPVRQDDLLWQKRVWREINVLEKQNASLIYAGDEHTGGGMLIEVLIDAINRGKITAYSTADDRFTTVMTKKELHDLMYPAADTVVVIDVDGTEVIQVVEHDFKPETITRYRIKEDWLFDRNTGQVVVRIAGIAPVRDIYDANNQYRGSQAMFWLYYPETRQILANGEPMSSHQDMVRASWDEFFEGRRFSSRIIKESQINGMSYNDMNMSRMEALYAGKKAEQTIFHKEHDVWEQ